MPNAEPPMWWIAAHTAIEAALVPGTTEVVRSHSTEETGVAWRRRCAELGIVLENPIRQFHDAACRALPQERRAACCAYVDDDPSTVPKWVRMPKLIGIEHIWKFFGTAADWFKSEESVSHQEANRRAGICSLCPLNQEVFLSGCPSCTNVFGEWAGKLFSFIGNRKTSSDKNLKACSHCGCDLRLLVWTALDAIQKNQTDTESLPSFCWKSPKNNSSAQPAA